MPKFRDGVEARCVDVLVDSECAALLRRCVADPRRTPEAIRWAARRVLGDPACGVGPGGELSARSVRVALAHLSAQRHALDAAYTQLVRPRSVANEVLEPRTDDIHQAYLELLRALPDHVEWCCDKRAPSCEVARMQLACRARSRDIDAWRRGARLVAVEDVGALGVAAAGDGEGEGDGDGGFGGLYDYLRDRLAATEHPKLERFVRHAIRGVRHETIARECGMSHEALRKESSRFAKRAGQLIDGYDG